MVRFFFPSTHGQQVKNTFLVKVISHFSQGIHGPTKVDQQVKSTFQVKEILPFSQENPWAGAS
jgi:hypothetical protein